MRSLFKAIVAAYVIALINVSLIIIGYESKQNNSNARRTNSRAGIKVGGEQRN
jgi:hypothetical protein